MTYLTSFLPFGGDSALPPAGSNLLISDTLSAPAEFAIYHLVSAAVFKKVKVVWVDFRGTGRASWEAVYRKLGTSLPSTFVHITPSSLPSSAQNGSSSPSLFDDADVPTLKPTFEILVQHISSNCLIILDGLTELVYLGFSALSISRFIRAILPSIRSTGSRLITSLHADHLSKFKTTPEDPQVELLERIMRLANGWWRVEGLSTGRSADVHGEISAHPLFSLLAEDEISSFPRVSKAQPLQYRLETGTVKVFPKGTGRGYL